MASDTVHTVQLPPVVEEKMYISSDYGDKNLKIAWAKTFSRYAGNVTPKNVQSVADALLEYMNKRVANKLSGNFGSQVFRIENEGRRTRFTIKNSQYEEQTGKIFISGEFEVMIPSSAKVTLERSKSNIRKDKVYEIEISIDSGEPEITYFDTYFGQPKTKEYLAKARSIN
ncbi:hypothetical protein A3715_15670 [Oleiphilus sp. HI0009]|nr:hypothetical protein A3715_15670 [Oleiphilus sp. HI0009]